MLKKNRKLLIAIGFSLAGLLGGFLYWRIIGCRTGSCPLTSSWHISTLIGGLTGYLIGDSVNDLIRKREKKLRDESDMGSAI